MFYSGGLTETRSCRFENVRWCFQGGVDRGNDTEARPAGQPSGIDLRNEMPHTSEIEKAPDDLIIDEAGGSRRPAY